MATKKGEETTEVQTTKSTVYDMMEANRGKILDALPAHLNGERFLRIVVTSIRKNPKLGQCDPASLVSAIMSSAQLGLEPDGILGQAYLIPYYSNKNQCYEAQFQIGYKGLLDLARRSDKVGKIISHVVYEKDEFNVQLGVDDTITHKPYFGGDRGELIAAYAIAHFTDGTYQFEVMSGEEIEKTEKTSKAAKRDDAPWVAWKSEMWRKTVLKRLCKLLPQSVELSEAIHEDNRGTFANDNANVIDVVPDKPELDLDDLDTGDPKDHEGHDSKNALKPEVVTEEKVEESEVAWEDIEVGNFKSNYAYVEALLTAACNLKDLEYSFKEIDGLTGAKFKHLKSLYEKRVEELTASEVTDGK